ncbi:MAG: glycoside hydrolase family 2, partial [Calditrichaeota bacterium]
GRRIFLRGTNYIGTQWLAEMNAERYGFDLGLMKQANINGVRVHAHVAAREFYRRCDEMGMLVWQDFPLQWGYVDDPEFYREAERQAKDMIHLLYNHPSVIAWSLHNEPPWDATWMQYKYRHYNPEQNRALDERLYRVLQGMDSTRYLHKYSATGEHPWYGWYSGHWKDYARPTHQPLITEFGAQALPDLPSLQKIFTGEALWPDTEEKWQEWEYHNFQRRETFEIAGVPMGNGIEEFIRNTQEYQARLIQYAAESYRRQRYRPVAAIFQFMFVEDWPSVNWGIVDYWRNPKPGYQALRIAYQPVLPGIEWDRQRWEPGETVKLHFWVINDLPKAFPDARLSWTLRQGESIRETQTVTLSIPPDSGRRVVEWKQKGLASGEYRLQVRLEEARGEVLGTNEFRFTVGQPAIQ